MSRKTKIPFDKCPKCGKAYGFYTKEQASGPVQYQYNFDGSEADNSSMYDAITYTGGDYAYCNNCGKRIFRVEWVDTKL